MVRERLTNPSQSLPKNDYTERVNDFAGKVKDGLEHVGGDFPPGMEPRGNGWYTTPDEAVDPRDCDRYPESIYCGGNPVSKPSSPVGMDFDWGINGCGVYGSVKGEVAGFSLPTHSAAWIRPECRDDYERKEYDRKNPPIEPPPDWSKGAHEPKPQYRPQGFSPNDMVAVVTTDTYYSEIQQFIRNDIGWAVGVYASHGMVDESKYPTDVQVPWWNQLFHRGNTTALMSTTGRGHFYNFLNSQWVWRDSKSNDYFRDTPPPHISTYEEGVSIAIPPDQPYGNNFNANLLYQFGVYFATGEANVWTIAAYYGRFGDIFPEYQISPINYSQHEEKDNAGRTIARSLLIHERNIVFCKKLDGSTPPWKPHYDSPPPPKKDCCMQCCSQNQNPIDTVLLARILREIMDLKKKVGTDEYPVKVPAHFNRELKDDGSLENPQMITVNNLTQLQGWQAKVLDGLIGQWGIGFEVRDTDPNKEGDQPGRISISNLAEFCSELYQHVFDMWLLQYQQTHLMQRHAVETMLSKKVAVQNNFLLDAIADYLGFHRTEKTQKIPFLLNLDSERFEDFVSNAEKEILVQEYDHDPKKNPSLRDDLLIQRMAASVTQAVHTRKFNVNGDMVQDVIKHLTKLNEHTDKVNKDKYKTGESDFDEWLREAENAFTTKDPYATNPSQPYGVPLSDRPRLKRVTPDKAEDATGH